MKRGIIVIFLAVLMTGALTSTVRAGTPDMQQETVAAGKYMLDSLCIIAPADHTNCGRMLYATEWWQYGELWPASFNVNEKADSVAWQFMTAPAITVECVPVTVEGAEGLRLKFADGERTLIINRYDGRTLTVTENYKGRYRDKTVNVTWMLYFHRQQDK